MGLRKMMALVFGVLIAVIGVVAPVDAQDDPVVDEPVDAIEAVDDVELVSKNGTTTIDVVGNDSGGSDDADVVITIESAPASGGVTLGVSSEEESPVVEYTPDAGASGTDVFGYKVCVDGSCDSATVTVYIGMSSCSIVGTNGDDTLVGTEGDDIICGRKGHDVIDGLGGNDIIFGGRGGDTIDGGDGDDLIRGQRGNDTIVGGAGADTLRGGRGVDHLDGGSGSDRIYGGAGADTLVGGEGDDLLVGKAGADSLSGGVGDDVLRGWRGPDVLDGGAGDDTLYGGRGQDSLSGGDGNDVLFGRQHADVLSGGVGDDDLRGNRGADSLDGGPGIDALNGGRGEDECATGESYENCEDVTDAPDLEPPVVTVDTPATWGLDVTGQTGVGEIQGMAIDGSEISSVLAVIEGVEIEGTIEEDGA